MAVPDDDALAYRTRQVAALRGLLAQRTAERDAMRAELERLRAGHGEPEADAAPQRRRWIPRRSG